MKGASSLKTGYCWTAIFGWADQGDGAFMPSDPKAGVQPLENVAHPVLHLLAETLYGRAENSAGQDPKRRAHELIEVSGLLEHLYRVACKPATRDQMLRVHTAEYHDMIHQKSEEGGGDAGDGITRFGKGGYDIAALAAGSAIEMTKAVLDRKIKNGYALVHPSGHHVEPGSGKGFAIFNNVAIATQYAMDNYKLKKIAIVDFDVHHGNGSQTIFYNRSDVLTISVHQNSCFPPMSGYVEERGALDGEGYHLNIPLPLGFGNGGYEYVFDKIIIPALAQYEPELIMVSSGVDAGIMDPLGRQAVTSPGFASITDKLMAAAEKLCDGKLVFCHEGGYSATYSPVCVHTIIERLSQTKALEKDPYFYIFEHMHGSALEPSQVKFVDETSLLLLPLPTKEANKSVP